MKNLEIKVAYFFETRLVLYVLHAIHTIYHYLCKGGYVSSALVN